MFTEILHDTSKMKLELMFDFEKERCYISVILCLSES